MEIDALKFLVLSRSSILVEKEFYNLIFALL